MAFRESTDEQQLVRKMQQGDSKAMRTVYDRYVEYLTAVCSRYVVCDDFIHDVLQESFIQIFTNTDKFVYRGKGSLKAWMSKIVVNEALKFLKKNEKFDTVQYERDLPDVIDEPDTDGVPADAIEEMIQQLPVGYRTVFNLVVFEGKSHKEIASLLNIKENTSASQFHRAKYMLAKMINDYTMINYE